MYAIVEDSGTQIKVSTGDVLEVDVRDVEGDKITLDRVLMIGGEKGKSTIGAPYVDGASVAIEVLEEIKSEKLDIIKFKRRKGYRRKTGHRQRYLRVRVGEISAASTPKKKKATTKKKTAKKTTKKADEAE